MKHRIVMILLVLALCYVGLSVTVYRFQHPEMSETELFLHIPDALLWQ